MPWQNRVTPYGEIVADPGRGMFTGNRGILHDDRGRLGVARWRSTRWIYCLLAFKGRGRTVMQPGLYTHLFFLDEATALAAGHRPCAECQRDAFNRFRDAWRAGNGAPATGGRLRVAELDALLHRERVGPDHEKVTYRAALDSLPDGVFIQEPALPAAAPWLPLLVLGSALYHWSAGGYQERLARPAAIEVDVLTPRSTVNAIAAGFTPAVHPTASAPAVTT